MSGHDGSTGEPDGEADGDGPAADGGEPPREDRLANTPGRGVTPEPSSIEPAAPEEFGRVQVWWGDGKGKTTAALGLGMRAVGHGYRVHLLQFMKGGAASVEAVRGEYDAISALPGFTCETTGHFGWHGFLDGSDDDEHAARAAAALARTRDLVEAAREADLTAPLPLDGDPEDGVHLLLLDEAIYAANRGLVDPDDLVALVEGKPDGLELVLTGGHESPDYLLDAADLVTNVRKVKHPFDEGQRARKGTEY